MILKIISYLFIIVFFLSAEEYKSPISPQEKRILDYKKEINNNSQSFPNKMSLFFQGFRKNYAIFYDHNGHTAYYQYRKNKFDRSKKKIIAKLIPGVAYEVKGNFVGMFIFEKSYIVIYKDSQGLSLGEKKNKNNIPVFDLQDCKEKNSEQIIF